MRDGQADSIRHSAGSSVHAAKAEFQGALEQFASVVTVPRSELKETCEVLAEAFEDAEDRATRVRDRIDAFIADLQLEGGAS